MIRTAEVAITTEKSTNPQTIPRPGSPHSKQLTLSALERQDNSCSAGSNVPRPRNRFPFLERKWRASCTHRPCRDISTQRLRNTERTARRRFVQPTPPGAQYFRTVQPPDSPCARPPRLASLSHQEKCARKPAANAGFSVPANHALPYPRPTPGPRTLHPQRPRPSAVRSLTLRFPAPAARQPRFARKHFRMRCVDHSHFRIK